MEDAAAGMLLVALAAMAMVMVAPVIFYLLSLQKSLHLSGKENQRMRPGMVWLNLIPVFNLGWHLYTVLKVGETLSARLGKQGGDGGRTLGILTSLLALGCLIPAYRNYFAIATLVAWVAYWVRITGYNVFLRDQLRALEEQESA
ncbi:MAG: hypothetical protein P1U54_12775 [Immundisolibacteraceae bacterium]|nr:hypothetical protein [Immundisolibacteraceae bacterium]